MTVLNDGKETIILGDMNVNYLDNNDNKQFKSILRLYSYTQLVNKPTRVSEHSSTLIDLIATNNPSNISKVDIFPLSPSDHDMVGCIRKINNCKYLPRVIKCRNYVNYSSENMNIDIESIDWSSLYKLKNVNLAVKYFNSKIEEVFNRHAPVIVKKVKGRPCPWLNPDLKRCMNNRDKILRKARKSKNRNDWKSYKKLRNKCNNTLKAAKIKYHKKSSRRTLIKSKNVLENYKRGLPKSVQGYKRFNI